MFHFLDRMSAGDILIGGFGIFVVVGALGAISNAVLKDNGFGTAINGTLLLVGAIGGAMVRSATLGIQ